MSNFHPLEVVGRGSETQLDVLPLEVVGRGSETQLDVLLSVAYYTGAL